MKRLIGLLLLVAAALGTAWAAGLGERLPPSIADRLSPSLIRPPAAVTAALPWTAKAATPVLFYGNVDIREVQVGFRVGGRLAEVLADEGDRVAAGAVLARLDPKPAEQQAAAARARLAAAEADLARLQAGARPAELATARAQVAERVADLRFADLSYERAQQLHPGGVTTDAAVDRALANRDMAVARVDTARGSLQLLEDGARAEEIAAARARRDEAAANLAAAETSLADTTLVAPSDGVVLSRIREPGAILAVGSDVFALSLERPVWVRAYVAETDLGRVRPGAAVSVTTDSAPDRPLAGRVGFVSPVAEFTPKSVETPDLRTALVYRFRVVVDDPGGALRQGMPVTLRLADPDGAGETDSAP